MKIASVIVVLVPLLASCASSGLYNMSDEWCSAHVNASEARCPKDLKRVAHNDLAHYDSQRVASNDERRSD